jgi:hypothetical protein
MKGYTGRNVPALILPVLLLLCLFPPLPAQTQTGEQVETGRFGAAEVETPDAAAAEKGLDTEWLYLGFRLGPSLRFYTPAEDTRYTGGDTHAVSMDMALQANIRVLSFLSLQTELGFTWDSASLLAYRARSVDEADSYTKDYTAFFLQFPFIVQFDFYPGRFRFSPFFGAYYLLPLGKLKASSSLNDERESLDYEVSPSVGLLAGLGGALKIGPGAIIADLRYAADLGNLEAKDKKIDEFRRSMVSFTVGYELGFLAKKRGKP